MAKKSDRQQSSDDWTGLVKALPLYERGRLREVAREARNKRRRDARVLAKVTPKQYKAAVDLLVDALSVTQKAMLQIYNWPENHDNSSIVHPIIIDNRFILEQVRKKIPK